MKLSQDEIESAYFEGERPDFTGCTFIAACGRMHDYEEDFLCYFERGGLIYEAESAHCSCNGFNWSPAVVTLDYLEEMMQYKAQEIADEISKYLDLQEDEEEEKEKTYMNFEQFEKLLLQKEKVQVVDSGVPQNTPITEWIDCPRSKAVRRWGYNTEQRILGVQWLKADGTTDTYLYENVNQWVIDNIKKSKSIGKTMKYETAYRQFKKVEAV